MPCLVDLIDGVTVIVEAADRYHLGECRGAADMVAVPMADHEVIDVIESGFLGGRVNPFRIAVAIYVSGVEHQRLTRRRDDEGGCTAFDVDPIELQVPILRGSSGLRQRAQAQGRMLLRDNASSGPPLCVERRWLAAFLRRTALSRPLAQRPKSSLCAVRKITLSERSRPSPAWRPPSRNRRAICFPPPPQCGHSRISDGRRARRQRISIGLDRRSSPPLRWLRGYRRAAAGQHVRP